MGGLARRATLFKNLRKDFGTARTIVILSGPYEFVSQEENEKEPEKNVVQALAKAHGMLGYDAGYLAPEESALLKKDEAAAPKKWREGGTETTTDVLVQNDIRIGVVYFPFLQGRDAVPTKEQMDAVLDSAAKLRQTSNVVVGISPWGLQGENTLATTREKDIGALDIILGSGPGSGSKGRILGGDKTLWIRAFNKGKAVNTIEFLEIPAKGVKPHWKENGNIIFDIIALKDDIQPEPTVDALFSGVHN